MERALVIDTLSDQAEPVTSIYAETYFIDDQCDEKIPSKEENETKAPQYNQLVEGEWVSPSDLLIGKLDLVPPFTSKVFRGKTHQGILAIGDAILVKERDRFLKYMDSILRQNDAAWEYILEHEKEAVTKKVQDIYLKILQDKRKILIHEINIFYEDTLQELEDHLRSEINNVLISAHANIISDLNVEIKEKLKQEKSILESVLEKRYNEEVKKITHYYKILLNNEEFKNNKLVNQAIYERNDALRAFYMQIDAQNTTSTMYIMCMERKKCRIKQFLLEKYQSMQLAEKHRKIKERQEIIDDFKMREKRISDINKDWEDKIKNVLKLFLKFISFSLKLLPEQTTFLLDLEKLVILQLNEIQKAPSSKSSILVNIHDKNLFRFENIETKEPVCDKEPFEIEGDLSDPVPPHFGSRETLPDDVELPFLRLNREFVYAKCEKFNEVKDLLKSCKCPTITPESTSSTVTATSLSNEAILAESDSSLEPMLVDNVEILKHCPSRSCQDMIKRLCFPFMPSYLDFTEENYERVNIILDHPPQQVTKPTLIDVNLIGGRELPFAPTKEPFRNVETQYSSQEDLSAPDFKCPCTEGFTEVKTDKQAEPSSDQIKKELDQILLKRKRSLQNLIHAHPNLLKMFTDEDFDFVYTIK